MVCRVPTGAVHTNSLLFSQVCRCSSAKIRESCLNVEVPVAGPSNRKDSPGERRSIADTIEKHAKNDRITSLVVLTQARFFLERRGVESCAEILQLIYRKCIFMPNMG